MIAHVGNWLVLDDFLLQEEILGTKPEHYVRHPGACHVRAFGVFIDEIE